MYASPDPQPANSNQAVPAQGQTPSTSPDQAIAADLLAIADVLKDLQADLTAFDKKAMSLGTPITSLDQDLLTTSIRRLQGGRTLSASEPLENGDLYADLPSNAYVSLKLRIGVHNSMPESFFVREMGRPQDGAVSFYSMRIGLDASGAASLMFADPKSSSMAESADWKLAGDIVADVRASVAMVADKLNRPDLSQKLK